MLNILGSHWEIITRGENDIVIVASVDTLCMLAIFTPLSSIHHSTLPIFWKLKDLSVISWSVAVNFNDHRYFVPRGSVHGAIVVEAILSVPV